jgi:hypothetical protein
MSKNFQLNSAIVLRDIYRLLSLFAGDETILGIVEGDDPLISLRDQFMVDEVIHLLVSTATANRIHDEHMRALREDPSQPDFPAIDHECGSLWADMLDGEEGPLTFREACNKIIHAIHIVPETAGDPAENPLSWNIILRGHLGRKAWVAHLDLIEYARASVKNFSGPNGGELDISRSLSRRRSEDPGGTEL